jgi:hypothetical protein
MTDFDSALPPKLTWMDRLMFVAAVIFAVAGTVLLIMGENT